MCLCVFSLLACKPENSAVAHAQALPATTITALIWAPDWPEEVHQIAAEFTKLNPDIRVNVQFMIGNSVEENIKPRVASRNLPDLMSVNPNAYAAELADQGILADVSDTVTWNNMLSSLKPDWTTRHNKHFGIGGGVAATLIYYNMSMFEQAGIHSLPTNFREFLAVCEHLKKSGIRPYHVERRLPQHARQRTIQLRLCKQRGGAHARLEIENCRWQPQPGHARGCRHLCQDQADRHARLCAKGLHARQLR